MFQQIEERNRQLWQGHSHTLEDATHVIGGLGLGLLLFPALRKVSKPLGYTLLLASVALHFYADTVKPKHILLPG